MTENGEFFFSGAPSLEDLARFDPNDFGNAMRLILLAGGEIDEDGEVDVSSSRLLFVLGRGWIGYDGKRFDFKFGEDLARRMAHKVANKVRGLYPLWVKRMDAKAFWSFADGCGSSGSTSSMLRQAQSYLTVEIDAFDRDPLALNCPNGTVRMRLDEKSRFKVWLDEHDPKDRITRMTRAKYDPKAGSEHFERVISESLREPSWREYMHRCLGYCTTGLVSEQAFFVAQGRGRDGKSTILDACREALGDYAAVGDVTPFLEQRGGVTSGPAPELVKLAGDVRLVIMSEPPRGAALAEGRLKAWTSGSPISVRDLHAKPFDYRPVGKLFWEMNTWAPVKDDSDGIWRRIHTMLFKHQVSEDRVDRELPTYIRNHELDGVLAWLIKGVEKWITPVEVDGRMVKGLRPPAEADEAKANYRRAASPFGDWLQERCVTHGVDDQGRPHRTLSKLLLADFKAWSEQQGTDADKVMSMRAFGDALRARQIDTVGKNAEGQKYRGPIRLKTPEELARDQARADALLAAREQTSGAGGPLGGDDIAAFDEDPFCD